MIHSYQPRRQPCSERLTLNHHDYHILRWGDPSAPLLFMLHGWMDCAATFQFTVDALDDGWQIIAPDWRGFGDSAWNSDSYYSPDYLADLDALLQHYSPHAAANLVGHSMGSMVAGLYAGIRPERVAKLALVEGFGLPPSRPSEAPGRYGNWLKEKRQPPAFAPLGGIEELASKLVGRNAYLPLPQARFMATALTRWQADALRYRADPRHKMVNPVLYRLEEAMACWRRITAPVLWVVAEEALGTPMARGIAPTLDERRTCFATLQEVSIARAGHMVQWEQPEALAGHLARFFAYEQLS
ncbi:alpha/beta fold hydrolase [Vogesella oryzae]|uniref:alpha/beta fold hydrolase n=1 Tax=Vogesella oryzae TaxID=1735285 RepID=UPI00158365D5|nr:alpha/beta hydrolase [Vogesella oryzae]